LSQGSMKVGGDFHFTSFSPALRVIDNKLNHKFMAFVGNIFLYNILFSSFLLPPL
jgi:hypothetical protein